MGEAGLEGFDPQCIALGTRVESIGHDGARDVAVFVEEGFVEVEVEDGFSIGQGGEEGVDFLVDGMGGVAAGEDGEEGDFGVRHFGAEIFEDHADAFGGDEVEDQDS